MTIYHSIAAVIAANNSAGHHFFDDDTMRFFRSRLGKRLYGGRYFITSEQYFDSHGQPGAPRLYTIRLALADGRIDTVGDFQQFTTARAAQLYIMQLLTNTDAALAAIAEHNERRKAAAR